VVVGDEFGASLALGALAAARDQALPLPAACVALSPWVDLSLSAASITGNAESDPVLSPSVLERAAGHYLGAVAPEDPRVSPLHSNLEGLPATLIQASSIEILVDDATNLARALENHGVEVELEVWSDLPHLWHLGAVDGNAGLPEAQEAMSSIAEFIRGWVA
jgi:acetyl esterase/lipase